MTQRSGQRSRSGKCPEPITGSLPLRSRGTSKVTYAVSSPVCTPQLAHYSLAAPSAFGQLPNYQPLPLLPPECPLLGWGTAGGKLPNGITQQSRHCAGRVGGSDGQGRLPEGTSQQGRGRLCGQNCTIRASPAALIRCVICSQRLPSLGPVAFSINGDTAREGSHFPRRCPAVTWKQGCWEQAAVSTLAGTCSTRRDLEMEKTRPRAQLLTLSAARVCPRHTWL